MLALLARVASGRGQGRFGGAVYAAEKQEKPLGMRDEGPKQGAGTKVEATTDAQAPWSLGREVKNTLNIALWFFLSHLGFFVEKHDIFLRSFVLCP